MKRLNLFAASALIVMFIGNTALAENISYGAKIGMTLANITQTPEEWDESKSFKGGFTGGIFLNYSFNENLSIQPELLYIQKGVKGNLYDDLFTVGLTASFDYVELPVLLKYTFTPQRKFRPCIFAGPSFAYTISSELEVSTFLFSADVDFSSLTQVSDFGLVAGAGFEYQLGKGTLLFDARFMLGFTNVILSGDFEINGSTQTIAEDDFKNYGFAFMVGYGL